MSLKASHRAFILQYVAHPSNATKAYMAIYPNASYASARSEASRLLTKPNIQAEITIEIVKKAGGMGNIERSLSKLLASNDWRAVDCALTHLRAILGLDADSNGR